MGKLSTQIGIKLYSIVRTDYRIHSYHNYTILAHLHREQEKRLTISVEAQKPVSEIEKTDT